VPKYFIGINWSFASISADSTKRTIHIRKIIAFAFEAERDLRTNRIVRRLDERGWREEFFVIIDDRF